MKNKKIIYRNNPIEIEFSLEDFTEQTEDFLDKYPHIVSDKQFLNWLKRKMVFTDEIVLNELPSRFQNRMDFRVSIMMEAKKVEVKYKGKKVKDIKKDNQFEDGTEYEVYFIDDGEERITVLKTLIGMEI